MGAPLAHAQSGDLAGSVSGPDGAKMEGVLVTAKKNGSTIATTVVSDASGQYSFPSGRLDAGTYRVSIRAVGFVLDGPKTVDVAGGGKTMTADIKLNKTRNIAAQLSNAEWALSLPGTDAEKSFVGNCVGCHTLQPIMMSTYQADDFLKIFQRMGTYAPGSIRMRPQVLLPGPRGERPRVNPEVANQLANYLASINMSGGQAQELDFKTLPRPSGRATRVIITEYDLPRNTAQPHDVVVDRDGIAWYSDFGAQYMGELNPKTGEVKDYDIPEIKKGSPLGSLDLELDPDGNLWLAMMYQGGIAKMDRSTRKVQVFPVPAEWQTTSAQQSMVTPNYWKVDGKVWTNNQDSHAIYRLDVATGKFENLGEMKDGQGRDINGYGIPADKDNNLYLLEFGNTRVAKVDAKTVKTTIYSTPTARSRPRRGRVDDQGHLWFAQYGANRIGMLDLKTEQMKEWELPTKWSMPYDVTTDKNGEAWTGSMLTDQVSRLDPKTGTFVEYLLPRSTNIRRVFVDSSGQRPVLWIGNNHGASVIRLEPLD
jgi:streptogramin lyase